MKSGDLFKYVLLFTLLAFAAIYPQEKKVTIKAKAPVVPGDSLVYIIGNTEAMGSWNFMQEMNRESSGLWSYVASAKTGDTLEFKFTRGNWSKEAVDSNGIEFPNFVFAVKNDTTLEYELPGWRDINTRKVIITPERFANKAGNIDLAEGWKYKTGDDSTWAKPSFDDSGWEMINPALNRKDFDKINWTGIGWFRDHIYVDSAFWNKPFGFYFICTGAAEVYLDGNLLFRVGKIGNSPETEITQIDRKPKHIIFGTGNNHVLAVRYSNHSAEEMMKYNALIGFTALIMDINPMISQNIDGIRNATILEFIFSAFIIAFAVMHLLLFVFYPKAKENLFYSISMFGFAIVMYTAWQTSFVDTVFKIFTLTTINSLAVQAAMLFGLLTIYASSYEKMPKQYLVFVAISSTFALLTIISPGPDRIADYIFYSYAVITILEMVRVVIISIRKKDQGGGWEWVIGAGFIIAMMFIAYQILIITGVIEQPLFGVRYVFVYGIVILAVTVSIILSKKVSDTNKNLEKQLIQVKELSEKTIEQERKAREEEVARKILEADNARKTKELEEAHNLQMSMLPLTVPSMPGLEIAVSMRPATEVGGDYYDFKYNNNGELIIAVGDATGHGMKAGTMVATIKGLFTAENVHLDIVSFLNKSNSVIRDMHLGNLYMAMLLVKIDKNVATITSAGMPPSLLYRKNTKRVEEIRMQALPLGGATDFRYAKQETTLNSGDTLLLMSDGFPELFNDQKEILDYPRAKEIFSAVADLPPAEVINGLYSEAEIWRADAKQEDDITFVVVKVK
jgi:serine phosphatase RsbU (regulator of sigma subunit)